MAALIGVSVKPKPEADDGGGDGDEGGYTVKVPLDLLSEDGVPPQAGDAVSFSCDGTVQSADDENAMVKLESVNGQPVDESSAQEAAEDSGTPASGGGPPAPGSSAAMRPGLAAGAKKGGLGMF
jgi:hypothetical protein